MTQTTNTQPKPRKVRGTGTYMGDEFTFTPYEQGEPAQRNVKTTKGGKVYETSSEKPGTVVFSEVYYPSWQAFIDGNEVKVGRADYILRALAVPAGQHKVEFVFDPVSLKRTERLAGMSFGIMVAAALVILGSAAGRYLKRRRTANQA